MTVVLYSETVGGAKLHKMHASFYIYVVLRLISLI